MKSELVIVNQMHRGTILVKPYFFFNKNICLQLCLVNKAGLPTIKRQLPWGPRALGALKALGLLCNCFVLF